MSSQLEIYKELIKELSRVDVANMPMWRAHRRKIHEAYLKLTAEEKEEANAFLSSLNDTVGSISLPKS